MKKFNFLKKNGFYYFALIFCTCIGVVSLILSIDLLFVTEKPNFSMIFCGIVFAIFALYCFAMTFIYVKKYKRQFGISGGKLEFCGAADFGSVTRGEGLFNFKKQSIQSFSISDIPYCFITKFTARYVTSSIIEKEKVNNKNEIMGAMFLLNKFVYDEHRCHDSLRFDSLNRHEDYKSQFYETLCSMYYQEEVLNQLFLNGFSGEVYISSAIYEPRKSSFDDMFAKHSVQQGKIHIFNEINY